jgi:hypothetical protein
MIQFIISKKEQDIDENSSLKREDTMQTYI